MNNSDFAFFITFWMGAGALMLLGCVIVAFLIVGTVVFNMQNGWPLKDAILRALKDWP